MKFKNKHIIAMFLTVLMLFSVSTDLIFAINTNEYEIKDNIVQVTEKNTAKALLEKGILKDNIFGVAGNFFLTGFESVKISGHTHGNVATKKLISSTNFGSGFEDEISYIQEYTDYRGSFVKNAHGDSVVIFGKDFNITHQANEWKISGQGINSPQYKEGSVWQDTDVKFIDFDEMQNEMVDLSRDFTIKESTENIRFITDQNELNSIGMNGVTKALVLPNTGEDMYVYNTNIDSLGTGKIGISKLTKPNQTMVLNIDAKGKSNINLPSIIYSYNGRMSANEEVNSPRDGNVIVNIFDSTKSDRIFTGKVTTGRDNNIFLLAPRGEVKISEQFNGIIIANIIESSGTEIHRDRPTTPPLPKEEKVSVKVDKQWFNSKGELDVELGNDKEVTVELFEDGMPTGKTLKLNKDNNWTGEFKNLPKYTKGTENLIVYTIKEVLIEGYKSEISGDMDSGFVIKNTEEVKPEEFMALSVEKLWEDEKGNKLDKIYDENGKEVKEIVLKLMDKETGKK